MFCSPFPCSSGSYGWWFDSGCSEEGVKEICQCLVSFAGGIWCSWWWRFCFLIRGSTLGPFYMLANMLLNLAFSPWPANPCYIWMSCIVCLLCMLGTICLFSLLPYTQFCPDLHFFNWLLANCLYLWGVQCQACAWSPIIPWLYSLTLHPVSPLLKASVTIQSLYFSTPHIMLDL